MTSTAHMLVSGHVQGVGYRYWTRQQAEQLQLGGWVRNLHDGRVEIVASGPLPALQRLRTLCSQGPFSARVEQVHAWMLPSTRFRDFEIPPSSDAPAEVKHEAPMAAAAS